MNMPSRKYGPHQILFSCTFKSNLSVPPQFQVLQIFGEYTKYNTLNDDNDPITI